MSFAELEAVVTEIINTQQTAWSQFRLVAQPLTSEKIQFPWENQAKQVELPTKEETAAAVERLSKFQAPKDVKSRT